MGTRLFTSFMMPNEDSITDDRVKYWVDVEDEYDKVFNQIYPLSSPASALEAREHFWFTKQSDGKRFACTQQQICGFEEI